MRERPSERDRDALRVWSSPPLCIYSIIFPPLRFSSDANVQKALGMITDLFCASVPQALTLYSVGSFNVFSRGLSLLFLSLN
jgi:hypothetical protein